MWKQENDSKLRLDISWKGYNFSQSFEHLEIVAWNFLNLCKKLFKPPKKFMENFLDQNDSLWHFSSALYLFLTPPKSFPLLLSLYENRIRENISWFAAKSKGKWHPFNLLQICNQT